MFDKTRYGLAHRPSFGYKILKFMTFPSVLWFPPRETDWMEIDWKKVYSKGVLERGKIFLNKFRWKSTDSTINLDDFFSKKVLDRKGDKRNKKI